MKIQKPLPRSSVFYFAILLALIIFSGNLFSQETEKKEATKKEVDLQNVQQPKADATLPKIDLPEFVITGSEKIDLQFEQKTEKDEERIFSPSLPTSGERLLNVDESLTPKQIKTFTKTPSALNGKVFAGIGFYLTPQVDGWFGQFDQSTSFIVNGYYSESQGHLNDAGFWRGGFGVRGSYVLPESTSVIPFAQLTSETKYGRESYRAYGSINPSIVRDLSEIELSSGVGSRYALPYKSISGVDYTGKIGWGYFSASDSSKSSEANLYLNGTATTRFFSTALRGQVEYRTTGYTMNLANIKSGQWFNLRVDGKQLLLPELQFSFALQQFIYRGNQGPSSGRLYPHLELRYSFAENATMYTGFSSSVERNTLSSLIKLNRYIDFDAVVIPTDTKVNFYAGMEFSPVDEITTTTKLTYKQINNYPTFLYLNSAKVWEVLYLSGVRSTKFDISALYRLNQKYNITAYFSTQDVKQKDSTSAMPYIPKYTFGTVYHHFFDVGVHMEVFAEYTSQRYTNFSNTYRNAGFISTGAKAEVELFEHFRGYGEINNFLNRTNYVWEGYKERTIFLLLGISYNW